MWDLDSSTIFILRSYEYTFYPALRFASIRLLFGIVVARATSIVNKILVSLLLTHTHKIWNIQKWTVVRFLWSHWLVECMNVGFFVVLLPSLFFNLLHSQASVTFPFGFCNVLYFCSYYYVVVFRSDVRLYSFLLIIIIYYGRLHALDIGLPMMTSSLSHTSYSNTQITTATK